MHSLEIRVQCLSILLLNYNYDADILLTLQFNLGIKVTAVISAFLGELFSAYR